jgi:hypothetical protein
MEGADALGLIAEIGIAIAGFAGVVATLRAPGGRMGAYAALRIGMLLGTSGTVVLLALLPFALHSAGMSAGTLWAVSSSAMVVLVMTSTLVALRVSNTALPVAEEDRAPGVKFVSFVYFAVLIGNIVLQLANAASFGQLWPFYVGLLALTTYSLFMFAYVLFAPSRAEVQP